MADYVRNKRITRRGIQGQGDYLVNLRPQDTQVAEITIPLNECSFHNLSNDITINGVTVTANTVFEGNNALAAKWDSTIPATPATCSVVGTGAAPSALRGPFTDGSSLGAGVLCNGKCYLADAAGTGDVTTGDYVFEFVFRGGTEALVGTAGYVFEKRDAGATPANAGWYLLKIAGGNYYFTMADDAGNTNLTTSATDVPPAGWVHMMVFGDRSGSQQAYINGQPSGAADVISARTGSMTTTQKLSLGGQYSAGSYLTGADHGIARLAIWERASWLDTHLQATVALERAQTLMGLLPSSTTGVTVTSTRDSYTVTDIYVGTQREMHIVGPHWIPMRTVDGTNVTVEVHGGAAGQTPALPTNEMPQGFEDFSGWTGSNIALDANSTDAPAWGRLADGIVADSSGAGTAHTIACGNLSSGTLVVSAYLKAGDQPWAHVNCYNGASQFAYFDITNGVVGTVDGAISGARIDGPFVDAGGGNWYRVSMRCVFSASKNIYFGPAVSDGDRTFDGDDSTVNTYIWGANASTDPDLDPIYIPVVNSTRAPEVLLYAKSNMVGPAKGTVAFDTLLHSTDAQGDVDMVKLYKNGDEVNNYMRFHGNSSDNFAMASVYTGNNAGVASGPTDDIFDGTVQNLRGRWITDNMVARTALVDGTADSSVDPPPSQERLKITGRVTNVRTFFTSTTDG